MSEIIGKWRRSHYCGELRAAQVGQTVTLMGWVQHSRDHGGVIFLDLRDRYGITQAVCDPSECAPAHEVAQDIRNEYVVAVRGQVRLRPKGTANPNLKTGEIEVRAEAVRVLGKSKPLPFPIEDDLEASEEVRLKYRYLDLRRPKLQETLILRHRVCQLVRRFLDKSGFLEIETPFLTKSTPEGARDYLVPSRVNPGHFYALPQSPQLFKQILMVSGYDKYFQIVRCFRDEDLRADRQPEFTQIDLEMSFVEQDDVLNLMERLIAKIWAEIKGETLSLPFPRLSYQEAQDRFGTDKPDTRFGLEIWDVSDTLSDTECRVFRRVLDGGGVIRGFCVQGRVVGSNFSRRELDELVGLAQSFGAGGLVWIKVLDGRFSSPIEKILTPAELKQLAQAFQAKPGDLMLLVADKLEVVRAVLGRLRLELGRRLGLIDKSQTALLWVVDFPWLEYNQDEKRYQAAHHPFTSPRAEDLPLLDSAPQKVRAAAYDLVICGQELGGGSIRIHQPELQARMFSILGFPAEEARERFGFLLDALEYGAPPHGGIALGLDRLIAILAGVSSIREVMAFPKTQKAICPLTSAPAPVEAKQLRELRLRVV